MSESFSSSSVVTVSIPTSELNRLLCGAASFGCTETIRILVEAGANPSATVPESGKGTDDDEEEPNETCALLQATLSDHSDATRRLIELGANPWWNDGKVVDDLILAWSGSPTDDINAAALMDAGMKTRWSDERRRVLAKRPRIYSEWIRMSRENGIEVSTILFLRLIQYAEQHAAVLLIDRSVVKTMTSVVPLKDWGMFLAHVRLADMDLIFPKSGHETRLKCHIPAWVEAPAFARGRHAMARAEETTLLGPGDDAWSVQAAGRLWNRVRAYIRGIRDRVAEVVPRDAARMVVDLAFGAEDEAHVNDAHVNDAHVDDAHVNDIGR